MSVFVAPTVPYRPGQCPACELHAKATEGSGRCHGFAGVGYGGVPMLAAFDGESLDSCPLFRRKPGPSELVGFIQRVKFTDDSAWELAKLGTSMSNDDKAAIYFLRAKEVVRPEDRTFLGRPLAAQLEENLVFCGGNGADIDALRRLYTNTVLSDEVRSQFVAEKEAQLEAARVRKLGVQEALEAARVRILAEREALQKKRRSEKQCVACGARLGMLEKVLRRDAHRQCTGKD